MKIKKCLLLLSMISVMFLLNGCRVYYTYDLTDKNAVKVKNEIYYSREDLQIKSAEQEKELLKKMELVTLEDGKEYFKDEESKTTSVGELNKDIATGAVTSDIIYIPTDKVDETSQKKTTKSKSQSELEKKYTSAYVKMTFILSDEIVDTNGEIGPDKRTVTFVKNKMVNVDAYYAYTRAGKRKISLDKKAPVIKGLKKNKYYNELKKLTITDNKTLKSIKCNGKDMLMRSYTINGKSKKYWSLPSGYGYKQGKNKIVAKDLNGNKTTFTFLYDDKAPVVKKLKSYSTHKDKIVFYIKDKKSGIGKVTYSKNNGKQKKVGAKKIKKVKKGKYKGYYKVTISSKSTCYMRVSVYDKAGNINELRGILLEVN